MTNSHDSNQPPQGSFSERPQRTNPEMSTNRDSLSFVRKRHLRKTSSNFGGKFQLTMPFKIGAIALIFTGVVLSVWTMQSAHTPVSDEDLPVISTDFSMDDFKVAPGEDDEINIPHSDKEFYSELDSLKSETKDAFRKTPERPSEQVSQEALFAEAPSKTITEEAPIASTKEASEATVQVVENANDSAKQAYKAPAPTVSVTKPKKTLEMAIQETQDEVRRNANRLVHNKALSKDIVAKTSPQKAVAKKMASVASGSGYWVQVASLPTQALAQKEAKRLQRKSKRELKTQKYRTVRVDLGKPKGIRYRVHFGPFPRTKAVQKCKNLKGNEKISCLVVKG